MNSVEFYQKLPVITDFDQVLNLDSFHPLPNDWWIAVTDVVNSTEAIQQGQYKTINSIGGFTIAAVVNAVKPVQLPYVFGGDGAVFCLPSELKEKVGEALEACRQLAEDAFNLKLRISLIPYQDLTQPIFVSHFKKNDSFEQAVFIGGGMQEVERLAKRDTHYHIAPSKQKVEADFSGFECRWQRIPSPKDYTFSLLVKPTLPDLDSQIQLYRELLAEIDTSLGDEQQHHPLNTQGLKLGFSSTTLYQETQVKTQHASPWKKFKTLWTLRLENLLGWLLMKFKLKTGDADWGQYKQDFLQNSDFRKVDDMYRTVFSSRENQWHLLKSWLEDKQRQGYLVYGVHQTDAALVTCLISQAGVKHLHFVDGADGGYALAAIDLKNKLKPITRPGDNQ